MRATLEPSSLDAGHASIAVTVTNATDASVEVELRGVACRIREQQQQQPPEAAWRARIKLLPRESREIDLGAQAFKAPELWWPIGLGPQTLYEAEVSAHVRGGTRDLSHAVRTRFGFRELRSFVDAKTGGRSFVCNEVPVYIRGSNYIAPDMLLRASKQRCYDEVRMHANMGMNMIRMWGGAGIPYPALYDACDEYGILCWSEFWITGDCDGRGATPDSPISNPDWPEVSSHRIPSPIALPLTLSLQDHALFLACAGDTIKLLRNHPSVALWCGGNEQRPCEELDKGLASLVRDLDCDARPYICGSLWDGFGEGNGAFSDGPYGIVDDAAFFAPSFYDYGFNPEIGSVGVPSAESVRAIMSPGGGGQVPPTYARGADGTVQEHVPAAW